MSVITKDLGAVTAYAAAVNRGYTGTREEFETLMASYAYVGEQAAESASNASQSATNASQSAQNAETAKGTAQQAATDAQTAQASAQGYARSAQQSAQSASQSAQSAESAKNTAVNAVDGFAAGAQQALDSVNQAGVNWKSLAQAHALDSEAWAVGKRDGEDVGAQDATYHNNAKWYALTAATDATTASDAAQTATTKAGEAQASASAAAESARTLTIDATLTQTGQAADAKVVGDEITGLKEELTDIVNDTMLASVGKNICPPNLFDGYLSSDGSLVISSDWKTTDYIDVGGLTAVVFSAAGSTSGNRSPVTMFYLTTYDSTKTRIEQVQSLSTTYTVGENVKYIRFSLHSDLYVDLQVESGTSRTGYEAYKKTYKAVNDDYALKTDMDVLADDVDEIANQLSSISSKDYELYTPSFSISPGAIWDNGSIITTLANTKVTDYIDCSSWIGIKYTGANWLGARSIAFYDNNRNWISSIPAVGETTYYTNELISIPSNAKYVVFGDLTQKTSQTLRIEVSTTYKLTGKWTGKKWTCVGDSLTERNIRTTANYHDYVANATGITVINMGVSGSGYARSSEDNKAFYQRISSVPTDSDVVTIFGSFNDLGSGLPLGSVTDTGTTTIAGCVNTTIDNLQTLIPLVNLGIVAPTPWKTTPPATSGTAYDYVEMLKAICEHRSIPFLDLWRCSNLRPWDADFRAVAYSHDGDTGTHPDENGHKLIAPRFKGFLETLLM